MDDTTLSEGDYTGLAPAAQAVLRADDARYRAMLSGDLVALERLLSAGLSYTHSSALCEDKQQYLASLARGRFKYLQVQRSEAAVQVHGELAVINGKALLHAQVDGQLRVLDNRFLSVWKLGDAGWQMLAWASTPIPARAQDPGAGHAV